MESELIPITRLTPSQMMILLHTDEEASGTIRRGTEWPHGKTRLAIAALSLVALGVLRIPTNTYAQSVESPPLDPEVQIVMADDLAITGKCRSLVDKFSPKQSWQIQRTVL